MSVAYDVVVVGAGPYGLSVAAHLRGRGLKTAVFGRTLGMWREHMPKGVRLRSHWGGTKLSDPQRHSGVARFCADSGDDKSYALPLDGFVQDGTWVQQR